jgi:cysteine-rich repeat protein
MMMTNRRIQLWMLGAMMAGAAGLHGCKDSEVNPRHCWNASGDATCEQLFGAERGYCTTDAAPCGVEAEYGCVAERPVLDECYSPCGGGRSILANSQCPQANPDKDPDDKAPRCGNGRKELDEECDDGNWVADDGCTNLCTLPVCGDGVVQGFRGETCDDGNTRSGDGCAANCQLAGTERINLVIDEFSAAHAVVVDSEPDTAVVVREQGDSRLVKFDAQMQPQWSTEVVWSEFPSLAVNPDGDLQVGGRIGLRAVVQQFSPDGEKLWEVDIDEVSSCVDVASSDGYVVSTSYADLVQQSGVIVRHDRNTGEALTVIGWEHGPLGPVAVDGFGRVWTVGYGLEKPRLRVYDPDIPYAYHPIYGELPAGVYEDVIVDYDRNVWLLFRSPNRTSFKLLFIAGKTGESRTSKRYRDATANAMAVLPGGMFVVAGHTRDQSSGLLAFYSRERLELVHELKVGSDEIAYEVFYDVAVAPAGDYGVAVGRSGESIDNSAAWIYQFEI